MNIILVLILTAAVLFVIYLLFSREDKQIRDGHAPKGKIEGYYEGSRDRRRSQRFDTELEIKYNLLKSQPSKIQANSKNISESGVAVVVYEMLPKDSAIEMEIALPGKKENLRTKGRVAWCEDNKDPQLSDKAGRRSFVAGIEFIDTDKHQKEQLLGYINSHLAKK